MNSFISHPKLDWYVEISIPIAFGVWGRLKSKSYILLFLYHFVGIFNTLPGRYGSLIFFRVPILTRLLSKLHNIAFNHSHLIRLKMTRQKWVIGRISVQKTILHLLNAIKTISCTDLSQWIKNGYIVVPLSRIDRPVNGCYPVRVERLFQNAWKHNCLPAKL